MRAAAPPGLVMTELFDQSIFVRAAINGVVKEGVIAALLTATMILLFLGSWRSTFIVMISIPLSILASLSILSLLGYTLNVMTLGGLALAVGILVDDATVEIENIHRNLAQGKPIQRAILDGAQQIAVPAFVSTLAICIVFVSVVFLTGPAKYLFTPLALAVVFAMLASYLLSRTLVPVMVKYLIRGHEGEKPAPQFLHADSTIIRETLRKSAAALRERARLVAAKSRNDLCSVRDPRRQRVRDLAGCRTRLFSDRRRRSVSLARERAARHAARRERTDFLARRRCDPRSRSAERYRNRDR